MKKIVFVLLIALLLCPVKLLIAQEYTVKVQQFDMKDGLAHRHIKNLFKDQDGFLWIFGLNHLQRYDGYEFKSFPLEGEIRYYKLITQDEEGWLWFFNRELKQFCYLNPLTGEMISQEERLGRELSTQLDSLLNNPPFWPYFDTSRDRFHFGSKNSHYVLDAKTGVEKLNFPHETGPNNKIRLIDDQGYFWTLGLSKNSQRIFRQFNPSGQLIDTLYIYETNMSQPKLSASRYGSEDIYEWKNELYYRKFVDGANGFSNNHFYRIKATGEHQLILKAPDGYLIYGFAEGLIWCIGPSGWKVFNTMGNLLFELKQSDYDLQLFEILRGFKSDGQGRFYIWGSHGFNIIEVKKNLFTQYFSKDKENSSPIYRSANGIYVKGDSIWGYFKGSGLIFFQKEKPSFSEKILPPDNNLAILRDHLGNFWTSHKKHLTRWTSDFVVQKKIAFSEQFHSNTSNTWTLWEDESGCIWSPLRMALVKACPEDSAVEEIQYEEAGFGVDGLNIYHIQPDPKGFLWLCSDRGLFTFDPKKQKIIDRYHKQAEGELYLPTDNFFHLYIDSHQNRWLGTGAGLLYWNPATGEKRFFNRSDGLSSEVIYAVYEDDDNRLWLSSEYGIMSFDKETYHVQTYLPQDGVAQEEFYKSSHFQAKDGTIYLGGLNGITAFHPKDFIDKDKLHSKVLMIDVELFDGKKGEIVNKLSEIISTRSLMFHPEDRYVKFKFVLPTSEDVSKTLYAWTIEGIYKDWQYQKKNTLQFGALPYGNHLLRIKGQDATGGWAPNELAIQIRVLKPYYLQSWFIAGAILIILIAIFLFYKWRTGLYKATQKHLESEIKKATAQIEDDKKTIEVQAEELRQLDKVKSRFFANVSHELRTPPYADVGTY